MAAAADLGERQARSGDRKREGVLARARHALRCWRDRRRLLRSGLFDEGWYRATNPDLPDRADPARHYLAIGSRRGSNPNPLFDVDWYRKEYPDIALLGAEPVLHYLLSGAGEGRDPNPYFASSWYLSAYPDVVGGDANPLAHYIAHGYREGRRPSLRFDSAFYVRRHPEADLFLTDPLAHFLTVGRDLGYTPVADAPPLGGETVEAAAIEVRRRWSPSASPRPVALFVTHAADGRLKSHVPAHLHALAAQGLDVVLVVAADAGLVDDTGAEVCLGLYVRANVGYDFAAWAHLLKLEVALWDAPLLLFANDSVVGPVNDAALAAVMARIGDSRADLVALTENLERGWHLQSYVFALKPAALRNARVQAFFNAVRSLVDKDAVINRYEAGLAAAVLDTGLFTETLFRKGAEANPTLFDWRGLLEDGFPYLKTAVISGRHDTVDSTGWREALKSRGYDTRPLDLAPAEPAAAKAVVGEPTGKSASGVPVPAERISFYGPWNYDNGLGAASRGYVSALWRLKAAHNLHALKRPFHTHRRLVPGLDVRDFVEPADVAIVHLNPDSWHLLTDEQRKEIARARLRIGIWVWEMDRVPDIFRPGFEAVDVIWTPSRYCAEVFAAATERPVHVVPHVTLLPPRRPAVARSPGGGGSILYVFDGSSYLARKNPGALVDAFVQSGLAERGWRLTLKTKKLDDNPEAGRLLAVKCLDAPGVDLIDRSMSREALAELFAAADVYGSPHASEGFGLTVAEAMAAGKIVVATDYGGTRDVLDASCGFPVAYDLVELQTDHGHYHKGGRWAQVRVDALAAALAAAAGRVEAGDATLGERARARIAQTLSLQAVAAAMQTSLDSLVPDLAQTGPR